MKHTIAYRAGAIAFGALASIGAGWLMLDDIVKVGFNSKHLVSVIVLLLAIGATHYCFASLKAGQWGKTLAAGIIALAASGLVMVSTAGRNADLDKAAASAAVIEKAKYADAVRERDEARKEAKAKLAEWTAECGSGVGKACKGKKVIAEAFDARERIAQANVDRLEPTPASPGAAKALADVLNTLGLVADVAKAEAVIAKVLPYLTALVLEGAAGWFFLAAFPPKVITAVEAPVVKPDVVEETDDAELDQVRKLLAGKRPMTNQQIADALGISKGEASKRVSRAVAAGVVRRNQRGREVSITLH